MEGSLHGGVAIFNQVVTHTKEIKSLLSHRQDLQFQITVMSSQNYDQPGRTWWENNHHNFDKVALMNYGSNMVGAGWEIPQANPKSGDTYSRYIKRWFSIPGINSKLVLGMTPWGCEDYMVDFFKQIVDEEGLAGISFWQPSWGARVQSKWLD